MGWPGDLFLTDQQEELHGLACRIVSLVAQEELHGLARRFISHGPTGGNYRFGLIHTGNFIN